MPAGPDPADDADELQDRTLASRPEEQSQDLEAVPAVEVLASPAAQWRHVCAWVVDLTILGGATALLVSAGLVVLGYRPNAPPSFEQLNSVAAPFGGLCALLCFVYSALFGVLWRGRTPGRLAVGLHLVDPRGATPPPWLALVRATLSLVSFGLFLGGFWFALFDRRGQTWHDKLTHTFVVRLRAARP